MNEIADLDALLDAVRSGQMLKYLLFWGHTSANESLMDKRCFSQWYPAAFELGGHVYATAEHYMMAEKARLFGDASMARQILLARTPGEAKALGRKVQGYEESRWVAARLDIVTRGNHAKFSQHADCRDYLMATGSRVLVEASPVDPIWGIGLAAEHPDSQRPECWQGLNLLGFALMRVRTLLREV